MTCTDNHVHGSKHDGGVRKCRNKDSPWHASKGASMRVVTRSTTELLGCGSLGNLIGYVVLHCG